MPNLVNEQKQLSRFLPSYACLDQDVRPSLRYFRRAVQIILIQKGKLIHIERESPIDVQKVLRFHPRGLRAGSYSSTGTQPITLVKLGLSRHLVPKPLPFNTKFNTQHAFKSFLSSLLVRKQLAEGRKKRQSSVSKLGSGNLVQFREVKSRPAEPFARLDS